MSLPVRSIYSKIQFEVLLHRLACRRLRLAHSASDLRRNALRLELVEPEISESAGDARLGLLLSEYKRSL